MQTLAWFAPDSTFTQDEIDKYGHNGKVTRKMRIKKALTGQSRSTEEWANSMVKALDATYSRLAAISHERSEYQRNCERQLEGMLYALGGVLNR